MLKIFLGNIEGIENYFNSTTIRMMKTLMYKQESITQKN
jgi:hypothetical protein